eukprot:CAMPEP_0196826234 /NCGR_PEP_ID=MMETSP1362-20130617/93515_1 /TAXON_ID=163516 /ORGANISM="Leptocylindrus danicus, Strain CCMP1856" /LENGTH=209 /DNA_ID=CAMNT_0042206793 /DNA_START=125 /DNA_END=756 /DNA_ORIENTATION=-
MQQLVPKIHPFGATILHNKITPGSVITVAAALAEYTSTQHAQAQEAQQQHRHNKEGVDPIDGEKKKKKKKNGGTAAATFGEANISQNNNNNNGTTNNNHHASPQQQHLDVNNNSNSNSSHANLPPNIPSIESINVKQDNTARKMPDPAQVVHYTIWITMSWNILSWAEPTASIFWKIATMFHTLHNARQDNNLDGTTTNNAANAGVMRP